MHGSTFGFFRSDKFNAADPVKKTVLPYQDQQAGFTLGGPVVQGQDALLRVLRVRAQPAHGGADADGAAERSPGSCRRTRCRRTTWSALDYQQSAEEQLLRPPCSDGRATTRSRFRAAARIRRWPSTSGTIRPTLYGTWTHVVSNNLTMQVHLGHRPLLLVRRPDPVEHRPVLQHAVRRPGVPVSDPDASAGSRTTRTTRGRTAVPGPARGELAQGQARDEVRRGVPEGPATRRCGT